MVFELNDSLGFLLNRTNTRMKNCLLHTFKDHNVTPEQWAVLNCLWVQDGISPKDIAELTSKDQPTTVRILAKLEDKRMISRKTNSGDNRSFSIFLTIKGQELKNLLIPLAFQVLNKATVGIEENKIAITKEVLNQVYQNLEP